MRILVLGWYGHGNCGDESYREAFSRWLPGHELDFSEVLRGHPQAVILGGGDVLGGEGFAAELSRFSGRKLAVSVTATADARQDVLSQLERIVVRDPRSLEVLRRAGYANVEEAPDLAFLLEPSRERGGKLLRGLFARSGQQLYKRAVAVVVNSHLCDRTATLEQTFQFLRVAEGLGAVFDGCNASVLFLPFGVRPPWDDRSPNAWVMSRCKWWEKNLLVHHEVAYQEMLDLISACDTVVATRLHASIFATVAGVPFVDLTHHDKNRGFLEGIGKADWSLDYWSFDRSRFGEELSARLEGGYPHDLGEVVAGGRARLSELAGALFPGD